MSAKMKPKSEAKQARGGRGGGAEGPAQMQIREGVSFPAPAGGIRRRIHPVRGHLFLCLFFFFSLGDPGRGSVFYCFGVELLTCCSIVVGNGDMASKCGRGWWGCGAALRGVRSTSRYPSDVRPVVNKPLLFFPSCVIMASLANSERLERVGDDALRILRETINALESWPRPNKQGFYP